MENKRVQPPAAIPQSAQVLAAQVLGVVNMGLVEIQRQAKAS